MRTSSRPNRSTVVSMMRLASPLLATFATRAIASAPLPAHSATTACARSAALSATTSRAPSLAKSNAVARPIPYPTPVTMQTFCASRIGLTSSGSRVCDPGQDVPPDRHQRAALIDDIDVGERSPLRRVDLDNGVGERHRIADEHWRKKAHPVIAERYRGLVEGGALAFLDHHGRAGRHITNQQRAMGNAAAVFGLRHILLIDVINRKISRDPREQIDVGFSDGFCKPHGL